MKASNQAACTGAVIGMVITAAVLIVVCIGCDYLGWRWNHPGAPAWAYLFHS